MIRIRIYEVACFFSAFNLSSTGMQECQQNLGVEMATSSERKYFVLLEGVASQTCESGS